jgi:hypothetical protein
MRHERYIGWLRSGWSWRRTLVVAVLALVLVVPASVPKHFSLPLGVEDAHAANCRLITIYGKEKSSVGLVQYKLKERVYWCARRGVVTYYAVSMIVTYTGPFWGTESSDNYGYWKSWNGRWKGARLEWRGKTMEACVSNVGGCVKKKHPWIEVQMRANLQLLIGWNTRDLTITRVEI